MSAASSGSASTCSGDYYTSMPHKKGADAYEEYTNSNHRRSSTRRSLHHDVSQYQTWDAGQLGTYLRNRGLGAYIADALQQHRITGALAPLLHDDDLKEMGISIIGDRLRVRQQLNALSRQERYNNRMAMLWEGTERLFYSDWDQMLCTCNGCCPVDPSTCKLILAMYIYYYCSRFLNSFKNNSPYIYFNKRKRHPRTNLPPLSIYFLVESLWFLFKKDKLTSSHLKVKKVTPVRCGPVRLCCFGASYVSKNIDLSKVDDCDVTGLPAPCWYRVWCCASGKDRVDVESRFDTRGQGKLVLLLEEGHGETVANLILNQVEESQKIERI